MVRVVHGRAHGHVDGHMGDQVVWLWSTLLVMEAATVILFWEAIAALSCIMPSMRSLVSRVQQGFCRSRPAAAKLSSKIVTRSESVLLCAAS